MHGAPWSQLVCFNHFSCDIKRYSRADPERIFVVMRGRGTKPLYKEYLRVPPSQNHTHPFPEVCDLDNAKKDNVRIYICSHIHEGTNEAWIFYGQKL